MRINNCLINKLKNFTLNSFKYSITFIFINIIFVSFISACKDIKIYFSEISLIIKGKNEQNILSDEFNFEPDHVFVNRILNNRCKKACFLNNELNDITLIYENNLESCSNMFKNLMKII